jgi:hypothetical protein
MVARKHRHDKSALLHQTARRFHPHLGCQRPWDAKSLHGGVIVGLLALSSNSAHGGDDFVPARLTVDMCRLPGFVSIEVKTKLIRDGLRARIMESDFYSSSVAMARASRQLLRKIDPQGNVWSPPNWEAPATLAAPTDPRLGMHDK